MSTHCTRKRTEEPFAQAVGEAEPIQGLTLGELLIPPPTSVDPQQRPEVLTPEHPDEPHAQAYGPQGELMKPPPNSVDTQQSPEVLTLEHPDEPHAQAYGPQGELMIPSPNSVDTQQSPEVLTPEHPDEPYVQSYGAQTVPSRIQLPLRVARPSRTATQGLSTRQLAGASGTAHQGSNSLLRVAVASGIATQGHYSPPGMVRAKPR
ncbi:hypothetical protein M422DRAFT_251968 [Sphaerobolus stellatus SS14]|uniref:Uncharacterized protein n=1 Tax=Sphaerobolus stellatus (strain SS14) TaxID=990650 RepID=A0A0C9UNT5_SPHS4|nr:hypothetical protein M422DRAFT_251968 [Sphaerobolus stellatus SS14]